MLPIIVNVASFVLAIYLSILGKNKRVRLTVWAIAFLITIGNVCVYVTQKSQETLYFDILTPNITSKEAFDILKDSFQEELKDCDLIDILGSYYICFKKPNLFFHRFPEWVFLLRRKDNTEILEFRVSDGRIPPLPEMMISELDNLKHGQIANYVNLKGSLEYLGVDNPFRRNSTTIVVILDEEGRSLVELHGTGPVDDIPEVVESVNSKVFARVRTVGRPTDHVSKITVIENPQELGEIIVRKATFETNQFYELLNPITNWRIDVDEAINRSIKKGAKATPPGKFGMSGGPGVFRLYNSRRYNLTGAFWDIPYRIGIRPILIDASSGKVYAVNNEGEYSTKWEEELSIHISPDTTQELRGEDSLQNNTGNMDYATGLIERLNHPDPDVRASAAVAMQGIEDDRLIEPLIKALGDSDPIVRGSAAWALGLSRDKKAVMPLIDNLADDDEFARLSAAKALGIIGDTRALVHLERLSQNEQDATVSFAVREAIQMIKQRDK
jgi:hypothetical protein